MVETKNYGRLWDAGSDDLEDALAAGYGISTIQRDAFREAVEGANVILKAMSSFGYRASEPEAGGA